MEILLSRNTFTDDSTIGTLKVDGIFECYTLEDVDRKLENGGGKIYAKTAIPRGRYEVIINFSNRFQQYMPLLLNVPQYEGVRLHTGNSAKDSFGCILLGDIKGTNIIGQSKVAYNRFLAKLKKVEKTKKIYITIS